MKTIPPLGGGLVASCCSKAEISFSHMAKYGGRRSPSAGEENAKRRQDKRPPKHGFHAPRILNPPRGKSYFAASAASTALVTWSESGFTLESKRFRILPSRPIKNLVKFQRMLPGNGESLPASIT